MSGGRAGFNRRDVDSIGYSDEELWGPKGRRESWALGEPCMCGGCRTCLHDQGVHCGDVSCCGPLDDEPMSRDEDEGEEEE